MMKHKSIIALFVCLLLTDTAFTQVYMDFGGGVGGTVPVLKISAGYQAQNNVVTEAVMQPSLTRQIASPNFFGLKAGYNFKNLIPFVGYLYNYRSAEAKEMNGWQTAYALKYQTRINNKGGIYLEGMYAKNLQVTAGFHINF